MEFLINFEEGSTARKFLFCPKKHSGFFGGVRNGKTTAAVFKALILSLVYPTNRGLIGRKEYTELRDSTMNEFFKWLKRWNNGSEEGGIVKSWNRTDKILTFVNGSQIYFRCLEEFEKIKGTEFGWFYIDEVEEVPEETYNWVCSRLSYWNEHSLEIFKRDWTPYQVRNFGGFKNPKHFGFVTGNPHPGWVKAQFKDGGISDFTLFEATTDENKKNLPEGYIEEMRSRMPEIWIKRFIDGSWDVAGGAVFPEFSENTHGINGIDLPVNWYRRICLDHGWTNPTAVLWLAFDENENIFIYQEHYKSKMLPPEHAAIIKSLSKGQPVDRWEDGIVVYMDSATEQHHAGNQSVLEIYKDYGIFGRPVNNQDVRGMVLKMQQLIHIDPYHRHPISGAEGAPRLYFVKGSCPNFVEEVKSLEYEQIKPGTESNLSEKPKKYRDHAVNAFMYGIKDKFNIALPLTKELTKEEISDKRQLAIKELAFAPAFRQTQEDSSGTYYE